MLTLIIDGLDPAIDPGGETRARAEIYPVPYGWQLALRRDDQSFLVRNSESLVEIIRIALRLGAGELWAVAIRPEHGVETTLEARELWGDPAPEIHALATTSPLEAATYKSLRASGLPLDDALNAAHLVSA